jgi:hypothetical protein
MCCRTQRSRRSSSTGSRGGSACRPACWACLCGAPAPLLLLTQVSGAPSLQAAPATIAASAALERQGSAFRVAAVQVAVHAAQRDVASGGAYSEASPQEEPAAEVLQRLAHNAWRCITNDDSAPWRCCKRYGLTYSATLRSCSLALAGSCTDWCLHRWNQSAAHTRSASALRARRTTQRGVCSAACSTASVPHCQLSAARRVTVVVQRRCGAALSAGDEKRWATAAEAMVTPIHLLQSACRSTSAAQR